MERASQRILNIQWFEFFPLSSWNFYRKPLVHLCRATVAAFLRLLTSLTAAKLQTQPRSTPFSFILRTLVEKRLVTLCYRRLFMSTATVHALPCFMSHSRVMCVLIIRDSQFWENRKYLNQLRHVGFASGENGANGIYLANLIKRICSV